MAARLWVEAIGTFFLVLLIGLTVLEPASSGALAPLAIGVGLSALVYMGGHVSGAHYNPAVTLAILLCRRIDRRLGLPYVIVQIAAAVLAAGTVAWLKGDPVAPVLTPAVGPLIVAELLFTFALVFVILNVAAVPAVQGNGYYGAAIGAIVLAGAYAVGPVTGAAFNPAVTVSLWLMGLLEASLLWAYFVGQLAGGVLAAAAFAGLGLGGEAGQT